jgi:carbonic anhydrase/acetyltransferase-like protein (isoleucine patch superfamily)
MLYKFDGRQPVVGRDSYVSPTSLIIGDAVIGDRCYIGHGAILRADYGRIEIGSETAVEEGVIIHVAPGETCALGERVTVGHGAIIHSRLIGDNVVVGMGAIVSIRAEVGGWTILAEGAVVKQNQILPANVVAAGNPAAVVRDVTAKDREFWTWGKQLYVDLAIKHLENPMELVG